MLETSEAWVAFLLRQNWLSSCSSKGLESCVKQEQMKRRAKVWKLLLVHRKADVMDYASREVVR